MYSGCLINPQQPNVIAPPFLSPDCPDQLVVARTLENTAGRPAHCSKIGTSVTSLRSQASQEWSYSSATARICFAKSYVSISEARMYAV